MSTDADDALEIICIFLSLLLLSKLSQTEHKEELIEADESPLSTAAAEKVIRRLMKWFNSADCSLLPSNEGAHHWLSSEKHCKLKKLKCRYYFADVLPLILRKTIYTLQFAVSPCLLCETDIPPFHCIALHIFTGRFNLRYILCTFFSADLSVLVLPFLTSFSAMVSIFN